MEETICSETAPKEREVKAWAAWEKDRPKASRRAGINLGQRRYRSRNAMRRAESSKVDGKDMLTRSIAGTAVALTWRGNAQKGKDGEHGKEREAKECTVSANWVVAKRKKKVDEYPIFSGALSLVERSVALFNDILQHFFIFQTR